MAVQCLNEALNIASGSLVADSFRLRNRQLLVAAKRKDIIDIFYYGEESFCTIAARSFIEDIYGRIWGLDELYLLYPECRFLVTKSIGAYLIIYKITPVTIDVLRIIYAHSSIRKIKKSRNIKV